MNKINDTDTILRVAKIFLPVMLIGKNILADFRRYITTRIYTDEKDFLWT
ncbi:MAG TPA: hypothetical protein PLW02_02350 [Verrucomicrobiota bacterium]|nr:hypothetical protein [Verrucomicrobiota bacterium]